MGSGPDRDREATRILGTWVGNKTDPEEPWRKITETIEKDFRTWETRYPTLEGKRLIVQMIAGRKTQFLTRVQGMPKPIQAKIQKLILEFVWGKERATMNTRDIAQDPAHGGRKILDIARQNEAIDLMWVKQYLNIGQNRPKWTYMMDKILRLERPKRAKETYQMIENWNPLTQGWNLNTRSTNIPKRVHNTLRLAKKYKIELEALEPSNKTRHEMPVWLHQKACRDAARIYTTNGEKCLKKNHWTHYMRQLIEMLENIPNEH